VAEARPGRPLAWHPVRVQTPVYDAMIGDVLQGARLDRDRLAAVSSGITRLHPAAGSGPCPVCSEPAPCATRRVVDGLSAQREGPAPVPPATPAPIALAPTGPAPSLASAAPAAAAPAPVATAGASEVSAQAALDAADEVERPAPRMPRLIDLLDTRRTGRAIDLLLGGSPARGR